MRLENTPVYHYPVFKGISRGSNASAPVMVAGSEDQILIDAGTGAGRRGHQYLELMKRDGLDIAHTTKICVTHPHPDHYRGAPFFRQAIARFGGNPNVPIFLHPDGAKYLVNPASEKGAILADLGPVRKEITKVPDYIVEFTFNFLWGKNRGTDNVLPLKDGQVLPLGSGHEMKVIFTPGHSREHVAYLIDGSILISGDLISFKENDGIRGSLASLNNPLSDYVLEVQTLQKLAGYGEISTLITGHYGIISGKETIHEYFIQARQRAEEILENLQKTLKEDLKPFRLKELVLKVIPFKHYLSGASTREGTVYVMLKHLEQQGKVKKVVGPKSVTWSWAM